MPNYNAEAEEILEIRALSLLEDCHQEIERITKKISPVMRPAHPDKVGGATPDTTELELRLGILLSKLRELSGRIKI